MHRIVLVLFLMVARPCLASEPCVERGTSLLAGAAAANITPEHFPVSMTGSFQDRQATSAHDPLHARAIVLDDGKTRLAIVVCDSCLIARETFDNAKADAAQATGIPIENMLMSATHTHSAATAVPMANCRPDQRYLAYLEKQIAQAVVQAWANLEPATLGWAVKQEPSEVSVRRWKMKPGAIEENPFGKRTDKVKMNPPRGSKDLIEPAGPIDPDVSILSIRSSSGRPIALLANYSLHYVGGTPVGQLSADYFGEFAKRIGAKLDADEVDPPFVGIMSNGTSGDVNNYNFIKPRPSAAPFERINAVAEKIADVAFAAHNSIEHKSDVSLAMAEQEIEVAIRQPDDSDSQWARDILRDHDGRALRDMTEVYANEALVLGRHPGSVKIKLQALRIGSFGITANPCESFAQVGLDIKQQSPYKLTMNIGLANGYSGYLPTPEQHELGGYETWPSRWSFLEVNASRKITETITELLKEVSP